jgi:large subunit ribosomal protein L3
MKAIIGKKLEMSQAVTAAGQRVPITRIKAGPVVIISIRQPEKDGYLAVQLGYGVGKKISKPLTGHLAGSHATPAILREFRLAKSEDLQIGDQLKVADVFKKGEVVDVVGTSKGKGFAGGMKRHGFHGGPKTHGQSDRSRAPGSIGSGTTPGRVLKGKKMAGRMGASRVTTQGLEIIDIDDGNDVLVVKGAVPGAAGSLVFITKSAKKRKVYHGPQAQALPQGEEAEGEAKEESTTEAPTPAAEAKSGEEKNG